MAATWTASFVSATTTTAIFTFTATGFALPSNQSYLFDYTDPTPADPTTSQTRTVYTIRSGLSFSGLTYSWSFSGRGTGSGSSVRHTFTGLTPGEANTVTATLSVSYTQVETTFSGTQRRTRERHEDGTYGSWSDWSPTTTSSSIQHTSRTTQRYSDVTANRTVWTRPNNFRWWGKIEVDQTIEEQLYASDWNDLVSIAEKKANWINQNGRANYSSDKVSRGDWVTAAKYNSLARHCGGQYIVTAADPNRNVAGTLITAEEMNDLMRAVNSG